MAIQFWLLLAVALALTSSAVGKLLTARFVDPTDFAILSTSYYAVPLATAGFLSINPHGLAFLHPAAADPGLALRSLRYAVIAMGMLEAGRAAARVLVGSRFAFTFSLNTGAQIRILLWFVVLLAAFGLGIFLFGVRDFFSGYASEVYTPAATLGNAVIFSCIELLGLAILFALLLGERGGTVPFKSFIAVALLAMALVLVVRGKRLEVVSALLPAALLVMATRPWLRGPWRRAGISLCALFVLIIVSAFRVSDGLSWFNLIYYTFTEGVYAGHSLPGIEERLETMSVSYEHGARFLTALLAFVPRFLWEGKDALVYQGNLALEGVSPLGATSFLAETVLQGGTIAVAAVYGLMGMGFTWLMKFRDGWESGLEGGSLPLRFGAYLVAFVIFIPHFRDGIIPAIKLSLQTMLFFVALTLYSYNGRATRHVASRALAT